MDIIKHYLFKKLSTIYKTNYFIMQKKHVIENAQLNTFKQVITTGFERERT